MMDHSLSNDGNASGGNSELRPVLIELTAGELELKNKREERLDRTVAPGLLKDAATEALLEYLKLRELTPYVMRARHGVANQNPNKAESLARELVEGEKLVDETLSEMNLADLTDERASIWSAQVEQLNRISNSSELRELVKHFANLCDDQKAAIRWIIAPANPLVFSADD
jgi:thioredoxin-like negative regulator of GroEL